MHLLHSSFRIILTLLICLLLIQSDKILKLMKHNSLNDQQDEQFESMKDQVFTYDLLDNNTPKIVFSGPKKSNKERHKLQLLKKDQANDTKEHDWKSINKNIKKISSNIGKIIPIGSAIFRSNFQCGNISSVVLTGPNTYEIQLQKQTNSNRVSNWFYFSVEGIKGDAKFVIKGFNKSSSLYNEGMKVCYREVNEFSKWRRGGTKISYTNSIEDDEYKTTYELRFSYFFKSNERSCVEFACCFPYGLKRLYSFISQIKQTATYSILCKSFNGLDIPLLTIGDPDSKEVIIISARVHPGETVSSFIAQGFLKELVDGQFGRLLRENFLFKIVPMLNPDGVIKGNYRCSGYGCDLNRKWKNCKENSQPEIFYMRELIKSCNKDKKVVMYIDLHGHSRKKNVFFYGCRDSSSTQNVKPLQFPFLMEKLSQAFKFQYCSFNVQKDKEGTARVTMWRQLKIDYVYTLQSSFCGPQYGVNYLQADYEKVGKKLCEGIAVFFHQNLTKSMTTSSKTLEKLVKVKEQAFTELLEHPQLLVMKNEDHVGSQSQPQTGQIPQKDRNPQTGLPKPQLLLFHSKKPTSKPKKSLLPPSSNSYNYSSFRQDKSALLGSQASMRQRHNPRKTEIKTDIEQPPEQEDLCLQPHSNIADFEVQLGDFPNLVEMPSNKSSEMHQQRNIRVYSLTKNADRHRDPSPSPTPQLLPQDPHHAHSKTPNRSSLLHGREGVQYRRVRKLAEQTSRKQATQVHQLQGSQLYMSRLGSNSIGGNAIAPRFYPTSQQKSRRASVEIYLRRNLQEGRLGRREVSFKCTGTQIAKHKSQR